MNATLHAPIALADPAFGADALFDTLYTELHRLARRELNRWQKRAEAEAEGALDPRHAPRPI
jgi:hypothetical protein